MKGSVTADSAVPGCPSERETGGGKAATPRRNGRTANRHPIDEELEDEAGPAGPGGLGQDPPAEAQATPAAAFARRTVTTTMVAIAALTFTFSFGNCWALGLRLGVAPWLAPLVGPSVDLSVIGLLVGIRHMQLRGVQPAELRPARILLAFSGLATLALNIAEPLAAGSPGRAAYDSIPPLLLIGWAEVGPGLLSRLHQPEPPALLTETATATIGDPSRVPDRPDPSPTPSAPAALLPVAAAAHSAPAGSTVTVRTRTTDSTH